MEDLTIEDLIADVITNPTPVRVRCEPPPARVVLARRGVGDVIRGVLRRVRR